MVEIFSSSPKSIRGGIFGGPDLQEYIELLLNLA